jgi:hypothetical protein
MVVFVCIRFVPSNLVPLHLSCKFTNLVDVIDAIYIGFDIPLVPNC